MKILHRFNRYFTLVLITVLLSILISSFISINQLLDKQYSSRQAALAPFFTLIMEAVLKPLHVAQTLANDHLFIQLLDQDQVDSNQVFAVLNRVEAYFDIAPYVVAERTQILYSENKEYYPGTPAFDWYPRLKSQNLAVHGGIGNKRKPHFYVDVRLQNPDGELVGYVGLGKSLESFVSQFQHLRAQFNSTFYFVNQDGLIILSSDTQEQTPHEQTYIHAETWFAEFDPEMQHLGEPVVSLPVTLDGREFLISRISVPEIDWRLYVLTSMEITQSDLIYGFATDILVLVAISLSLFLLIVFGFRYYNRILVKAAYTDKLTGIPNRAQLENVYDALPEDANVCIIVIDVDNFKSINDRYGHNGGDVVLKTVAQHLGDAFRDSDILARWGGEEFVVVLTDIPDSESLPIAERGRQYLASCPITVDAHTINITASFGVANCHYPCRLVDLVGLADEALYQAKQAGRNCVRLAASCAKPQ